VGGGGGGGGGGGRGGGGGGGGEYVNVNAFYMGRNALRKAYVSIGAIFDPLCGEGQNGACYAGSGESCFPHFP
jgi:hypothetical protein